MIHELKIWPEYFHAIADGRKTYELREIRDRNFQTGDILVFREWDDDLKTYTGRGGRKKITYMTRGPKFGIADGWCVLALGEDEK